jgi:cob(I)alamin adenosyltransferase
MSPLPPDELMRRIDALLSHVWMVRTFVKHSDEAAEDDELAEVHRELYDFMLAVGGPFKAGQPEEYLKLAKKKLGRLRKATDLFREIQPEISTHTNFQMAVQSLTTAVAEIVLLLEAPSDGAA